MKKILTFFLQHSLFLQALALLSLLPLQPLTAQVVEREELRLLSREYADFRKSRLSNVTYHLSLDIQEDSDIFSGSVTLGFDMGAGNDSPLTIDFDEGEVLGININGEPGQWDYEQWFISLPTGQFNTGRNEIIIEYRRPFTTDGDGLHKFTDPENGEVYLYTNFEPYNANRFFPMFDQPNLKAPFTLDVLAPASWQVISNMREESVTQEGSMNYWQFPATPPVSTYLYALHAGPFVSWEEQTGDITLRLFARSALADYVNTQEWFVPTRQFMAFYQEYYDVPYPLDKYDQIIVPDFNPGAMENIGAVTFNEAYISRGEKSINQLFSLAYVIAHEMAHMWFGDIVTMEWWDDLWLNESFATYMGYLALDRASDFENPWDRFYSGGKSSAYIADSRVTTHPIALEVPSTSDAFANFDTITYQKGSSVLKQLPYFIGEENFRRGVSNYLKENSFANATLDDFVGALADSAGMNLDQWQEQWLKKSGANTIRAEFSCSDDRIEAMRLVQSVPGTAMADKVLRSQRTLVGLYRYTDDEMVLGNAIPVTYSGAVTWVPDAIGEPCPDMVFPNENDYAYIEIELDPVSLNTLRERINDFNNPTTRLMLWESLWSGVRDARMPLDDFISFAFDNIGSDTDDNVVRQVSRNLASAFNYYTRFGGHDESRRAIQDFSRQQLNAAPPGSEIQKIWLESFGSSAHTEDALDMLLALLNGDAAIEGIEIDQDKRWIIVTHMNELQFGDYETLLNEEIARDPSDQGANFALAARAIRPDASVKSEFIDIILNDPERYKLASLRSAISSLFPASQENLHAAQAQRILDAVPAMNANADDRYLNTFLALLPATCTPESVNRLASAIENFSDFRTLVVRSTLVAHQEDQRCVNIKAQLE